MILAVDSISKKLFHVGMKKYIIIFSLLFSFVFFYNLNGSKSELKKPKLTEKGNCEIQVIIKGKKIKKNKKDKIKESLEEIFEGKSVSIVFKSMEEDSVDFSPVEQEKQMEEIYQNPLTLLNSPKENYFEMNEILEENDICADEFFKCEKTEEKGQYCQPDEETLLNIRNWCFLSFEKLSSLHDFRDLLENKQEYNDFKKEVEENLNNYKIIYGDYIDEEIKKLNDYISSLSL